MIKSLVRKILINTPLVKHAYRTKGTASPITLRTFIIQKIFGFNNKAYWPCHISSVITGPQNIRIGIGCAPGLSPGCYIQGIGKIEIGDYTIVAPNVGLISSNHNSYDHKEQKKGKVKIGKYCWLGMNSVILPNVELGNHTIVGAGSIVTKSFKEGFCVIAGNPAKKIKDLDKGKIKEFEYQHKYHGYIPHKKFEKYFRKIQHGKK